MSKTFLNVAARHHRGYRRRRDRMRPRISGIFGPIVAVTLAAASLRAQPAPQPPPAPEPDAGAPVVTPPRESAVTPAPAPSQAPTPGYPAFPPPYNPYPYYPRYGYPPPTYAPPPDPRVEQRRLRTGEAHADHVILMPTAYTHPAGTVYFSSIDIVLLQAGYAISDDTQVTLSGTPPLGEDNVFPLDLSLKNAFVNEGPVRVAAIGSITGIAGLDEGNFFLGRIGGAAQLCFDTPCKSSASVASRSPMAPASLAGLGRGAFLYLPLPMTSAVRGRAFRAEAAVAKAVPARHGSRAAADSADRRCRVRRRKGSGRNISIMFLSAFFQQS